MISSDFRAEARRKLSGKWGKAVCIILAYVLIFLIISLVENMFGDTMKSLVSILLIIIEIPISFGLIKAFVKLYNQEDVKAFDFLSLGFSNFGRSWSIYFRMLLKIIVPIILVIVSYALILGGSLSSLVMFYVGLNSPSTSIIGIIFSLVGVVLLVISMIWATTKSYYYLLSFIIACDNPELTPKEAVEKSQELMINNRAKLFCLQLSFIGWAILCVFTLGIGALWLLPYIQFTNITFYKFLNGKTDSNEKVEVIEENNSDNTNE